MKAQQTRPLIGINADFVPATKINPAYARLNAGYFDSVVAAGGLPVVIPPLGKESELNAFLDQLDGVVLSSGLDMDPRRQGQPTHPAVQPMPERREDSDRILVKLIVQRKIPVLGINLGMLQLNAACGGSAASVCANAAWLAGAPTGIAACGFSLARSMSALKNKRRT